MKAVEFGGRFKCLNIQLETTLNFACVENELYRIVLDFYNGKYDLAIRSSNSQSYHRTFDLIEWYIEEGTKYNSHNTYCKELIDEKFPLKSQIKELKAENELLKEQLKTYRKKDDISICGTTLKTLACVSSTTTMFHYETDEFINHAHIKGSLTMDNNKTVTFDFEFVDDCMNTCRFDNNTGSMQWKYIASNSKYWMIISYGGARQVFNIELIAYYDYDEFALKSQHDEIVL